MKGYFFKNLLVAVGGVALSAAVFYYLVIPVEAALLRELVSPENGTVEEWAADFSGLQSWVILASVVVELIWLLVALIDAGRRGSHRRLWLALGLVAVLLGLVACIWLPPAQSGVVYAVLLSVLNAALLYWLGTAWWTPATHKYDPIGSEFLRARLPW
jgi:hypothetical protein